jgi:hypothetical protein
MSSDRLLHDGLLLLKDGRLLCEQDRLIRITRSLFRDFLQVVMSSCVHLMHHLMVELLEVRDHDGF